ncbi:MAG: RNA 2',3'-cyclic phosphodiesterase [Candidatus Micrarchaeia archaeon]
MRLFVDIRIPPALLPRIFDSCRMLEKSGARLVVPANLHITLKFIGKMPEEKLAEIEAALSAVRFAPFQVSLSGAGAFPTEKFPRAIWIGGKSEGADELAAKVEAALSFLHLKSEKFALHLTVARSNGDAKIGEFVRNTKEIGSFEVRSFFLTKSTLSKWGAAYEVVREFPAGD